MRVRVEMEIEVNTEWLQRENTGYGSTHEDSVECLLNTITQVENIEYVYSVNAKCI